jgi:hypothetical protein
LLFFFLAPNPNSPFFPPRDYLALASMASRAVLSLHVGAVVAHTMAATAHLMQPAPAADLLADTAAWAQSW